MKYIDLTLLARLLPPLATRAAAETIAENSVRRIRVQRDRAPDCSSLGIVLCLWLLATSAAVQAAELLVEAEGFAQPGGWVVDPQFMDVMGSSYLLAHGLGHPVANASTEVEFPSSGQYRLWVRTKDWVLSHHPGRFKVLVDGTELDPTLGTQGQGWVWQDGGTVRITRGKTRIELKDLTGFDGRCDALYFTTQPSSPLPVTADEAMAAWRRRLLGLPDSPPPAGHFDAVVVGGGLAGCAAALTCARLGLRVALVQDRPVLGGNASPEIGITPRGQLRSIVNEIMGDNREQVLRSRTNLHLFLSWHAFRVQKEGHRIASVDARHISTGEERRFGAPVFIDCTGTGSIGHWAGADYRLGREAASEFNESLAPKTPDTMHHGNSVIFRTRTNALSAAFPDVPWATAIAGDYADLGGQVLKPGHDNFGGLTHYWEYGQWLDPIADAEEIRDHLLRALYGTFANAKRRAPVEHAHLELEYVSFVPAGGESRRLVGDHILTENDIRSQGPFADTVATNSGHFCLHYPGGPYDFRLGDWKWTEVKPYPIPFRCLYSRNVANLMMAGKCASVSHIAGSSTKTMINGGQMGVATGAAAFLCWKHGAAPREVYEKHLTELQDIVFNRGVYREALDNHERNNGAAGPGSSLDAAATRAPIR